MRTQTSTPIPAHLLTGPRPARWRTLLLTTAAALTLTISAGGIVSAQDATPAAAECVPLEDGDGCLATAPASARVDLGRPVFSNPTAIDNPLFPISNQAHLLQLGVDAGESLRAEASVLPETKTVTWDGQEVETVVSQFVAYADGRVVEVAYDFFAQDDDGNVWYFGEDVFNYEDGVVANTDGTWLAGKDGPAGMIMPADPKVGDVYRPENIPGFVFEEVTVVATGVTVNGPRGPVEGAIQVRELLQDGATEVKHFAPGYGEFSAAVDTEFIVVALESPLDQRSDAMPHELSIIADGAAEITEAAPSTDWEGLAATTTLMSTVWEAAQTDDTPPVLDHQMDIAIEELESAVEDEDVYETRQAALDVTRAVLDLQLQFTSLAETDLGVMRLWAAQLAADVDSEDLGLVTGDVVALETVWDRVDTSVDASTADQVATLLADLRTAVDAGDLAAADEVAAELATLLSGDAIED